MSNLDEIKKQYGNNKPFKVPENYFEQFSEKLMDSLPEKAPVKERDAVPVYSMWSRVKPIVYLAAMLTAAVWAINLITGDRGTSVSTETASVATERENDAVSMKLAMAVDEYALYEYLTEEN